MIVDVRILVFSQLVVDLSPNHQLKGLAESLSSLLAVVDVIVVGLAIGAGT